MPLVPDVLVVARVKVALTLPPPVRICDENAISLAEAWADLRVRALARRVHGRVQHVIEDGEKRRHCGLR